MVMVDTERDMDMVMVMAVDMVMAAELGIIMGFSTSTDMLLVGLVSGTKDCHVELS